MRDRSGDWQATADRQARLLVQTAEVAQYGPRAAQTCVDETHAAARRADEADRYALWGSVATMMVLWLAIAVATFVAFAWLTVGPPAFTWEWMFALAAIPLALAVLAVIGIVVRALILGLRDEIRDRSLPDVAPPSLLESIATIIGCFLVIAAALWAGDWLVSHWPGGSESVPRALWLTAGAVIGALALSVVVIVLVQRSVAPDLRDELVLVLSDRLSVAIYGVCVRTETTPDWRPPEDSVPTWRIDRHARRAFSKTLADAGLGLEVGASRLAPRRAREVRDGAQAYGRAIAAGYINHARAVALGLDDDRVVQALADGWVAACERRWADLATAEPLPRRQRLARMVAERAVAVGVLSAAAIGLVPVLIPPDAQEQARAALLGAAILAATTPRAGLIEARDALRKLIR